MTITPLDTDITATAPAKSDTLGLKEETGVAPQGPEFGKVMSQLMTAHAPVKNQEPSEDEAKKDADALTSGQELAESGMPVPMFFNIHTPVTDSWSLKAVTLGPTLNVITPEKAAPDDQSLEAFARSQGLDETAVQWLMGTPPSPVVPQVPTVISAPSTNTAAIAATMASAAAATQGSSATLPPSPMGTGVNSPASAIGNGSAAALQAGAAALWAMAQPTESAHKAAATDPTTEATDIQIQLLREPTPAAVWMLRNSLNAEATAARRLEKAALSVSEIDLTDEISPEALDSLMAGLGDTEAAPAPMASASHSPALGGGHPSNTPTTTLNATETGAAPDAPESNAAQRSENIQNLAEKMGQAVGQRILSEIEKGQWHLKLQLRPATLGHIEVEMRMLSGELDAVFHAPQAHTRELLQDGMAKLKDTLAQMGMDVASMQVGDGQTRQRGGDSTPNQAENSVELVKNDSKSTNSQATWVPRQKMGEDGWDVTV